MLLTLPDLEYEHIVIVTSHSLPKPKLPLMAAVIVTKTTPAQPSECMVDLQSKHVNGKQKTYTTS